jgi:hypothetical protein
MFAKIFGGSDRSPDRAVLPQARADDSGSAAAAAAPPTTPPTPPSAFPQLAAMSLAELELATTDADAYAALLARVAAAPAAGGATGGAAAAVAAARAAAAAAARANLERGEEVAQLRKQVVLVRATEYEPGAAAFRAAAARQEAARADIAPEALVARLRGAAEEAAAAAADAERRLRAGELAPEAFVSDYTAARERYHELDLKRQAAAADIPGAAAQAPDVAALSLN